jgi:hypothetical protein
LTLENSPQKAESAVAPATLPANCKRRLRQDERQDASAAGKSKPFQSCANLPILGQVFAWKVPVAGRAIADGGP